MAPSFFISAIMDLPESLAWRSERLKQQPCFLSLLSSPYISSSDISIITCICLSLSPAFIERCMHGRHCFWFKSHQVVLSILQTALLGDTRRNFVQGSNLWWNWPGSAVRVVFSPHLCLLLTYLIKEGNFFHRRHLIMSGWNCVCSIDSEKSLIWGNPAICCSGKKGCAWKKTRQNAKDRLKIRWER